MKLDTLCLAARQRYGKDAELIFANGRLRILSHSHIVSVPGVDHQQCIDRMLDERYLTVRRRE